MNASTVAYEKWLFIPDTDIGLNVSKIAAEQRSLITQLADVIAANPACRPLTPTQLVHRLAAVHGLSRNSEARAAVAAALETGRRTGAIPFEGVSGGVVPAATNGVGYLGLAHFQSALESEADGFTLSRFIGQQTQVFLICDIPGLVSQLARACAGLPVTVMSGGACDPLALNIDIARRCVGRNSVAIHVGDFSPSSLATFHSIVFDIAALIGDLEARAGKPKAIYAGVRIGLLAQHITEFGLPTDRVPDGTALPDWFPGIDGDVRATCSVEALPPPALAELVRRAVEEQLDVSQIGAVIEAERGHRDQAMRAVAFLKFTN